MILSKSSFILSCESTVDLPYSVIAGRGIPVLFYHYTVNGEVFADDMMQHRDALPKFYAAIANGALPTTSQINVAAYLAFLEPLLQKGDVLHLVFGSGMTNSIQNALIAAEELRAKYPNRRLAVIDSTCSSAGYGLLTEGAADLQQQGKSMDEVLEWIDVHRYCVHHQFFSGDMKYFRRSGRVSGIAATVATVLGICPVMRLNHDGRMIAYGKVRGKKAAFQELVSQMQKNAVDGAQYNGRCIINHANNETDALELKRPSRRHFRT